MVTHWSPDALRKRAVIALLVVFGLAAFGVAASFTDGPAAQSRALAFDPNAIGLVTWNDDRSPQLTLAGQSGAKWVRIPVSWYWLQVSSEQHVDHDIIDQLNNVVNTLLTQYGIQSYISIEESPAWVRHCYRSVANGQDYGDPDFNTPCPTDQHYGPPHDMYIWWRNFVDSMVTLVPNVHHWAIWNEPNSGFFKARPGDDPVVDYKTLVEYAADPIHAKGDMVLGPELGGGMESDHPGYSRTPRQWLDEFLYYGGWKTDIGTVHAYADDPAGIESALADYMTGNMQYGNWRLWLTEVGIPRSVIGDAQQHQHLRGVYERMLSGNVSRWDKTFYFAL